MTRLLLICLGGAIGTGLRYLAAVAAVRWLGPDVPYGTLAVNLLGAFLIGLIQEAAMAGAAIPPDARLFLVTGVMGGLTTYSAFTYETVALMRAGAWPHAVLNVAVTTLGCLLLCVAGMAAGRTLAVR